MYLLRRRQIKSTWHRSFPFFLLQFTSILKGSDIFTSWSRELHSCLVSNRYRVRVSAHKPNILTGYHGFPVSLHWLTGSYIVYSIYRFFKYLKVQINYTGQALHTNVVHFIHFKVTFLTHALIGRLGRFFLQVGSTALSTTSAYFYN
jgi:hypothetical protein